MSIIELSKISLVWFHFIIAPNIWPEEAADQYCPDNRGKYSNWGNLVTDQESCQKQCELDNECIGISYSHDSVFTDWCFICISDKLKAFGHQFGFYRKTGKNPFLLNPMQHWKILVQFMSETFYNLCLSYLKIRLQKQRLKHWHHLQLRPPPNFHHVF